MTDLPLLTWILVIAALVLGILAGHFGWGKRWPASISKLHPDYLTGLDYLVTEQPSRPYWKARGSAILVTVLLAIIITLNLATLLGGDFVARYLYAHIWHRWLAITAVVAIRGISWLVAVALLMLIFSTIYYFAPDLKAKRWHWLTPGAAMGIIGWVLASLGLRVYLHYFGDFSPTYGSLGAVIVLLTWFYISGLMLLLGAELNSEIQAAVAERKLKQAGELPAEAVVNS